MAFFAINLPEFLREELLKLQQQLISEGLDATWVHPEDYHVTLLFLGGVTQEEVSTVSSKGLLLEETSSFQLGLGKLGFFEKKGGRGVLWVDVNPQSKLYEIHKRLTKAFPNCDSSPFRPHITIGRIRNAGQIPPSYHEIDLSSLSTWSVEEAFFMKRKNRLEVQLESPLYKRIHTYQFQAE